MKCFFCGGEMRDSYKNDMFDFGDRFVITKNIPCHKCSQCGETSYDLSVVKRLEDMMSGYDAVSDQVTVTEY